MTMRAARILLVLVGVLLPYVARLPGGADWLRQYTNTGISGFLLLTGFNAITWGALLVVSRFYRNPGALLAPALLGYGFLVWAHYSLDLASDAQAAVALVVFPIFAVGPIAVGAVMGSFVDRWLQAHGTRDFSG